MTAPWWPDQSSTIGINKLTYIQTGKNNYEIVERVPSPESCLNTFVFFELPLVLPSLPSVCDFFNWICSYNVSGILPSTSEVSLDDDRSSWDLYRRSALLVFVVLWRIEPCWEVDCDLKGVIKLISECERWCVAIPSLERDVPARKLHGKNLR